MTLSFGRHSTSLTHASLETPLLLSSDYIRRHEEVQEHGLKWLRAFEPLLLPVQLSEHPTQEHLAVLQVHATFIGYELVRATSTDTDECSFDRYTENFKYIVDSSHFWHKEHQRHRISGVPGSPFGIGFIMCLSNTATRCRDIEIRHAAIDAIVLFPTAHRGVWNSVHIQRIAHWIADI
jgi:hypothetical protein